MCIHQTQKSKYRTNSIRPVAQNIYLREGSQASIHIFYVKHLCGPKNELLPGF